MTTPRVQKAVLPPRALTALQLVADGFDMATIAGLMSITGPGVSSALATARKNLGAYTTYQAVATGIRRGLIS